MIATVFVRTAEACAAVFGAPLPKRMLRIGDNEQAWGIEFNNSDVKQDNLDPMHIMVYWNGFPAGIIDPSGGILAVGDAANEDALIEWLQGIIDAGAAEALAPQTT